jgi:hypothetical protein
MIIGGIHVQVFEYAKSASHTTVCQMYKLILTFENYTYLRISSKGLFMYPCSIFQSIKHAVT